MRHNGSSMSVRVVARRPTAPPLQDERWRYSTSVDPLRSCDFRPEQAHRGNNSETPVATQNGRMRMTPQEPRPDMQCVRTFFGYMAHHLIFV